MKRGNLDFRPGSPGSYPPPGTSPHLQRRHRCHRQSRTYPIGTRGANARQPAPLPAAAVTFFQITAEVSVQKPRLPVMPMFAASPHHSYDTTGVVTGAIAGGMATAGPGVPTPKK